MSSNMTVTQPQPRINTIGRTETATLNPPASLIPITLNGFVPPRQQSRSSDTFDHRRAAPTHRAPAGASTAVPIKTGRARPKDRKNSNVDPGRSDVVPQAGPGWTESSAGRWQRFPISPQDLDIIRRGSWFDIHRVGSMVSRMLSGPP
jgi:hypothetical protein